ncbi:hypothetical protein ACO2KH_18265 [Leptospira terpstrae]|uniref:hypothetical protein n=1 Tax=Leptospira terpstrae TaxID=293075 RepID=UPI003CFD92BB
MILLDTNILYEFSIFQSQKKYKIIKDYLKSEHLYTNLISFFELSLRFTPIEAIKIIENHNISIITPLSQSVTFNDSVDHYFKRICVSDELINSFFIDLKEKIDLLQMEAYSRLVQIMLSIFTYSTIFSEIPNPTSLDIKNYQYLIHFIEEKIPKLFQPTLNEFLEKKNLEKNKSLNKNLNTITLAFSIYLDALLICHKKQIDYIKYLTMNQEIVNSNKEYIFSKKIQKFTKENKGKILKMYSNSNTYISFSYMTEIIFDYIINNRKITMNDVLDSIILSAMTKYKVLTFDSKMLDYLRKHDINSYKYSSDLIELTNFA